MASESRDRRRHPGRRARDAVARHLPDLVMCLDRDGRILFVNDAVRILGEEEPQRYVGRLAREIAPTPEFAARVRQARESVFATGRLEQFEIDWPRPTASAGSKYESCPSASPTGASIPC
jgi:PAS domain-containing protein